MKTMTYEVDVIIGRDHVHTTEVEAGHVDEAAWLVLEDLGGGKVQDPKYPLPEVEHGNEGVVGTVTVEAQCSDGVPRVREIVE